MNSGNRLNGAANSTFLKGNNMRMNEANEIQKQLVNVIDKNNKVTSTHNKVMRLLSAAIVFLAAITLLTNYNKTGRYAISTADRTGVYVLDTKTSQLWVRALGGSSFRLGTNKNPEDKPISIKSKDKQKE